ncbi:hypothetical protein AJ78_07322 [Emergomyces pasteurianus Ep9510]|uniref:Hyaluronan/mRNA-binding protein domain-containing protein n=1 Tax=Emergomyces pasteurianus Ep9510 TaxID=1447872 RepID=A0A1J9PVV9_9EURO|nr:hypothetical protein AJ78_07322 [Emergomyces pasteurianus Ep9510]
MSDVRSKNLYELLGNDPEEDSDREPEPPTTAITKPAARHGKREGPSEPPRAANPANARAPRPGRGGGGRYGNEQAFRDRDASARANRSKPVDAPLPDIPTGVVKNRDVRGNLLREDRTNRSDRTVTSKQVEQGWGATSGESAWEDERAGEATARKEGREGSAGEGNNADAEAAAAAAEAEDKAKSYAEYLAEQAEQRREDLGVKEARKPNEGVKADKKWATAKELKRDDDEEAYIKGKEEKARREKARKEKAFVEVDMRFVEQPRGGRGGGEGGHRGGRGGRGGERGHGGRGGAGGRGRGGEFRGGAPRGGRGGPPAGPSVNVDEKNFPALGGK